MIVVLVVALTYAAGFSNGVEMSDFTTLYPYKDFVSVNTYRHEVPLRAEKATWTFQADNSYPQDCDHLNVTIVLQHGSVPVVNPLGEKLPANFFVSDHTAGRVVYKTLTNNLSLVPVFSQPKAGPWYTVAYLPKADGKLRPADLYVDCVYRLRVWFSVDLQPDVLDLTPGQLSTPIQIPGKLSTIFRFFVPLNVYEFRVSVSNCSHGNVSGCAMSLALRARGLPGPEHDTARLTCMLGEVGCVMDVFQPTTGAWNYLAIQAESDDTLTAAISILTKECMPKGSQYSPDPAPCTMTPMLDQLTYNTKFHSRFVRINNSRVEDVVVTVTENQSEVVPVYVSDSRDNGGSMMVHSELQSVLTIKDPKLTVQLDVCLMKDVIPKSVDILFCNHGYQGNMSSEDKRSFNVTVPYPQADYWFLGLMLRCFNGPVKNNSAAGNVPCGETSVAVLVNVSTYPCVQGGCSDHGRCINYLSGQVLITTCRCDDGWRGFDCSDGTERETDRDQLMEVLLLTLSNLVFLPAIVIATYRRHYVEALVYAYNMVFSALYHACDGGRREGFTYCALPIGVLSTCDFLASATSIWVTLVAMSRPPLQWKALVQMLGPLGILVGVMYRKTSIYLFLIPACTGILLLVIGWVCRCCYRHKCYPGARRYVLCLVPGWCLAAGGLVVFAYLENQTNYLYTHSAWHALMAISVCLLLPPRDSRVYKVKKENGLALGSTYQPIRSNDSSNYAI